MKPKITRQNYGVGSFINYRWRVENHPIGVKSFSTWKQAIRYALKMPPALGAPQMITSDIGEGGSGGCGGFGGSGAIWPPILDSPSIGIRFRQIDPEDVEEDTKVGSVSLAVNGQQVPLVDYLKSEEFMIFNTGIGSISRDDDEPLADYNIDREGHMTPLSERAQNWREADNADAGYC